MDFRPGKYTGILCDTKQKNYKIKYLGRHKDGTESKSDEWLQCWERAKAACTTWDWTASNNSGESDVSFSGPVSAVWLAAFPGMLSSQETCPHGSPS